MRSFTGRLAAAFPVLVALALPAFGPAQTQPASTAVITVEFSNPQASPSHWVLKFHPDGSGHFRSSMEKPQIANGATTGTADWQDEMGIPGVDRDVQLTPRFAAAAFQAAKQHAWFNQPCESNLKVAFQGWKKLSYSGPDGQGSCTFNYSRDKQIESLGDSLVAVSATILEGARLEMLLEHDPLGLEKEIESFTAAAQDGYAQQIGVIKGILERLAQDDSVLQMVRKRARLLLEKASS